MVQMFGGSMSGITYLRYATRSRLLCDTTSDHVLGYGKAPKG